MNHKVLIGIGSNIGDKINNCIIAIKRIKEDKRVVLLKQSSFYLTSPVSYIMQEDFINCAICIDWDSTPLELIKLLNNIEKDMGRIKEIPKGPRIIDLDIIFFGDLVLDTDLLKIPHPEAHRRKFVIIPCTEIEPEIIHPVFQKKLKCFLSELGEEQKIIRL